MTQMLDYARELGIPMGSLAQGHHISWTTNQAKADTLRGARYTIEVEQEDASGEPVTVTVEREVEVTWVPTMDKQPEARKFDGWEIRFPVGAERVV